MYPTKSLIMLTIIFVCMQLVALVLYFNQIGEEINEYLRSKTQHTVSHMTVM